MKRISAIDAAETLLAAGVKLIQFRHKAHFRRAHLALLRSVAELCKEAGATLVVNDRADIAMLLGCALHIGQDDLAPMDARLLLGERTMIGHSTHNAEQLKTADAEPVDYLAIGPIFGTRSKDNPDPVVGVAALPGLRELTGKPLVAIGGITLENAPAVYEAGADSVALISALIPEDGDLREMRRRAEDWLALGHAMTGGGGVNGGGVNRRSARDMV